MKHTITVATTLALLSGAAFAQTSSPAGQQTSPASPETTGTTSTSQTMSSQQQDAVRTQVREDGTASVPAPSGFAGEQGDSVPPTVVVHQLPADITGGPGRSYAVIGNTIYVIDPERKVVEIVSLVK